MCQEGQGKFRRIQQDEDGIIQPTYSQEGSQDLRSIALCKKHGDPHMMHNTSNYHKYEKDGKLKKGFGKGQHGSMALDKTLVHSLSFLQRLQTLRKQTRS